MAELKTKRTTASVEKFLNSIADETRRKDCFRVLEMMKKETRSEPAMWGTSIVGFGHNGWNWALRRAVEEVGKAQDGKGLLVHQEA